MIMNLRVKNSAWVRFVLHNVFIFSWGGSNIQRCLGWLHQVHVSEALVLLYMLSPGARISTMVSACSYLVPGLGWLEFLGLARNFLSVNGSPEQLVLTVAFPQSKHSKREEVWEFLVFAGLGLDTSPTSCFYILSISLSHHFSDSCREDIDPACQWSMIFKSFSLLSPICYKMY